MVWSTARSLPSKSCSPRRSSAMTHTSTLTKLGQLLLGNHPAIACSYPCLQGHLRWLHTMTGILSIVVQEPLGHCLFIVSAFMLTSKVICDNTYSNKAWLIVAQRSLGCHPSVSAPMLTSMVICDDTYSNKFLLRVWRNDPWEFIGPKPY